MAKLLLYLCILILPNCYLLLEADGQSDITPMFPMDREGFATGRIIGGEEVLPHTYPFQIGLYLYSNNSMRYFCGGTLITTEYVLTAAHCLDLNVTYIRVYLGAHNVSASTEPDRIVLNTTSWVSHPGWNRTSLINDIGLVRLPINVTLNEYVRTVPFARGNNTYGNRFATMIGWGSTENTGTNISPVLRRVNSSIFTNEVCKSFYPAYIIPTHICAAGNGTIGTCGGDSGGPLLVDGVQVGITSFGTTNCMLSYPSVFTRITEFEDWIEQHIGHANTYNNLHYSFAVSIMFCLYQFFVYI